MNMLTRLTCGGVLFYSVTDKIKSVDAAIFFFFITVLFFLHFTSNVGSSECTLTWLTLLACYKQVTVNQLIKSSGQTYP